MSGTNRIEFDKQTLEFINDDSPQKTIMGSPGSGKSSACCFALRRIAEMQDPDENGIRRSKFLIVRRTVESLYQTTARSVHLWFSEKFKMRGGITGKQPPSGKYKYKHIDGTYVDIEIIFKSMNTDKAVEDLKSLEVTAAWLNECNELEQHYLTEVFQRTHRFPPKKEVIENGIPVIKKAKGTQLITDYNPQDLEHWTTKYYDSGIDNGVKFFKQPPAVLKYDSGKPKGEDHDDYYVNPNAPNIRNLTDTYYPNILQILLATKDYTTIENKYMLKYTDLQDNDAVVFGLQFTRDLHVGEAAKPQEFTEVLAGFDTSGNHPCIVLGQEIKGQFHLQNGFFATGVGREDFTITTIVPLREQIYNKCRIYAYCDPHDGRDAHLATSSTEWYSRHGISAYKAPTNDLMTRIEAVRNVLSHRLEDGRPYIVIDKGLTYLIEGLARHYAFATIKGHGTLRPVLTNRIDKAKTRPYSDWVDAFQYLCLELNRRINASKSPINLKGFSTKKRKMLL